MRLNQYSAIAVEKADENDIKELRTLLKQMEGLQDDLEQLAIADLDFQYKIAQISRNFDYKDI